MKTIADIKFNYRRQRAGDYIDRKGRESAKRWISDQSRFKKNSFCDEDDDLNDVKQK